MFLTGFMGAGKTTVGRRLAARLGVAFVDLDAAIERDAGLTVAEIFERHGEARFRALERRALERTAELAECVVATGGGVVVDAGNRAWMASRGRIVLLDVPFAELRERLGGGGERPLYAGPAAGEALYRERLPAYRESALRVDAARRSVEEIVEEIASRLGEEPQTPPSGGRRPMR